MGRHGVWRNCRARFRPVSACLPAEGNTLFRNTRRASILLRGRTRGRRRGVARFGNNLVSLFKSKGGVKSARAPLSPPVLREIDKAGRRRGRDPTKHVPWRGDAALQCDPTPCPSYCSLADHSQGPGLPGLVEPLVKPLPRELFSCSQPRRDVRTHYLLTSSSFSRRSRGRRRRRRYPSPLSRI